MRQDRHWLRGLGGVVLVAGLVTTGFAQDKPVSDAQIEANVLKSLASAPELADQAIGSTTVYGTVTLSGSVESEALRDKAEQLVANTAGVKKVVDELTIGTPAPVPTGGAQPAEATVDQTEQGTPPPPPSAGSADSSVYQPSYPPQAQSAPAPATPQGPPAPIERSQEQGGYPPYSQPPSQTAPGYPTVPRQPYRVQQQADRSVIVPVGTMIRVRINQAMDSRHTQPGAPFEGVVLNDVLVEGMVAIPRGAAVQGHVSDTQPGGDLRGRGGIALELSQVSLEGHPYPLVTESWSHQGYDKTGQTVGTTVGLGAAGATIGAIAGGGPGALLGAGIGAIAGLGLSSASHQGEAAVPSEAILSFRLAQQSALMTVSQAELDRLGAGLPPPPAGAQSMRRRYYPPPPPPNYYGPAYYPYTYPYYRNYR
ncbi:BON domain-containing protein [Edaphobacter modestus]|uniref:BON domain-containing protein n=1 Tax=Edaphobacter modestus TaxID=388466 RepID=A0A4Q7YQP1_9BACT|nr:BON domain-containing protein [Edaphobacter modestus]RZU39193.1 BON domain-containing protein [Edaphobacter modestus]